MEALRERLGLERMDILADSAGGGLTLLTRPGSRSASPGSR
ncbi:hypothetical protein ACWEWG_34890 [Streptomyces sp. NPDC003758]